VRKEQEVGEKLYNAKLNNFFSWPTFIEIIQLRKKR
jgi:hypothetical protein